MSYPFNMRAAVFIWFVSLGYFGVRAFDARAAFATVTRTEITADEYCDLTPKICDACVENLKLLELLYQKYPNALSDNYDTICDAVVQVTHDAKYGMLCRLFKDEVLELIDEYMTEDPLSICVDNDLCIGTRAIRTKRQVAFGLSSRFTCNACQATVSLASCAVKDYGDLILAIMPDICELLGDTNQIYQSYCDKLDENGTFRRMFGMLQALNGQSDYLEFCQNDLLQNFC